MGTSGVKLKNLNNLPHIQKVIQAFQIHTVKLFWSQSSHCHPELHQSCLKILISEAERVFL